MKKDSTKKLNSVQLKPSLNLAEYDTTRISRTARLLFGTTQTWTGNIPAVVDHDDLALADSTKDSL